MHLPESDMEVPKVTRVLILAAWATDAIDTHSAKASSASTAKDFLVLEAKQVVRCGGLAWRLRYSELGRGIGV